MAVRRGQPQVVLVEGDAGSGKSSLLVQFAARLADAAVLRAGGDEAELLLPYGIVGQLTASARGVGGPPGLLAADLSDWVDPLAVGADLVVWLGQCCRGQQMALVVIDDLQWADGPSARALLFAVRRLQADRVLVVVSARPEELARLGEGWLRLEGPAVSGLRKLCFLSCYLQCQELVADLLRRPVPVCRVKTLPIVTQFDVARNITHGLFAVG